MKQRTKNISIILAVVIVAAVAALVQVYGPQEQVSAPTDGEEVAVVEKPYTNEKGEKWGPLQEKFEFQVTSAEGVWPKFLEGKIDPLDVHVGDIQKMKVVVWDPSGITSVIAEIETDNGTTTVPLKKTGVVTYREMMPEKYVVESGVLKVLNPIEVQVNRLRKIAAEAGFLGGVAQAQSAEKEVWEGEWLVKDTHVRTYHTTFIATSNSGQKNSLTMAWSDPCNLPATGGGDKILSDNCTLGVDETDGWDGGNLTIAQLINLTLQSGSTFAWNPGQSITVNDGGTITLSGGALKQLYVYYTDADDDRYAPNSTKSVNSASSLSGYVRRSFALGINDCYDSNANAYPGQTAYFTTTRGTAGQGYDAAGNTWFSYDYNCDGVESQQYSSGSCHTCTTEICPSTISYGGVGYQGSVPSCGYDGTFINNPGSCDPIACTEDPCTTVIQTQACR